VLDSFFPSWSIPVRRARWQECKKASVIVAIMGTRHRKGETIRRCAFYIRRYLMARPLLK